MARGVLLTVPQAKPRKGWACLTCGAWFPKDKHTAFEMHTVRCAQANEHIEQHLSPRRVLGIFGGEMVDVELETWVRRNRGLLLEDRKKL